MRWISWICAPSPTKLSRVSVRALQPELLEPRLVLSHAPMLDFGPGPGQDVAGQSTAGAYNSAAYNSAVYSAPLSNHSNWSDDGSMEFGGFGGPGGQAASGSSQSPALLSDGPGNGSTRFGGNPPGFGVGSSLLPGEPVFASASDDEGEPIAVDVALVPTTVEVVQAFLFSTANNVGIPVTLFIVSTNQPSVDLEGYGESDSQLSAENDQSPPPANYGQSDGPGQFVSATTASNYNSSASSVAGPSVVSAPYLNLPPAPSPSFPGPLAGTTAHAPVASNLSDVGATLTFGIFSGNQPGATQSNQAVVPPQSTAVESAKATAPNNAPGVMSAEVVTRGLYTEPLNADSATPLRERSPGDREFPPAPSGQYETSRSVGDSPASIGAEVESSAAPEATREALLAGIATNFEIVDHALQAALEEIEKMGGDFVTWLDESNATSWAVGGAVVLLAGGGFYWQRRRGARQTEADQEELSSWLLTHLCNPTGRS